MNIALVIGCARSGTSILGELIAAHPDVRYVFEAHHLWELGGPGVNDSHRLTERHATLRVRQKIRKWLEAERGSASLVVEKNPRNTLRVPFVRAVFPEARIVHIVRDGRDVACSMVPGCGGATWSHLKPPAWKELLVRYEGALRCALAWKEVMEIVLGDLAEAPHLEVRYEELVRSPSAVARSVGKYLGLREDPAVQRFCEKICDSTPESYHAAHQSTWYRDDHGSRIGRWRENLTAAQQRQIGDLLGALLRKLGYE